MSKKIYAKPALTYTEQLQLLKNRGLAIANDSKALHSIDNRAMGFPSNWQVESIWK